MQSAYTKYHNTETALICLVNDIQRAIDDQLNSFFFVSLNSFFAIKGALWYVAIATATFSSVKTTCYFYMSRYHIFLWKQTRYLVDGYIEDITRWREDMNFILEWQNNILRTSAASE